MIATFNGRQLEIDDVNGPSDDDIQFALYWIDAPTEQVPDEVYEYISANYAEELYCAWFESKIGAAEYALEGDR